MSRLNKHNLTRGINYFKRNGLSKSVYKALERIERDREEKDYDSIARESMVSEEEINRQKQEEFAKSYKISILIPVYETEVSLLIETLESVARQSYGNWELCIADASKDSSRKGVIHDFCEEWNLRCTDKFGDVHSKVKYVFLDNNYGISGNSNEALKLVTGDYVALLDHDDTIEPDALYMFIKAVNINETQVKEGTLNLSRVYMAYTDEDKVNKDNTRYFDLHKKPDFDPILLLTNNYICHLLFVDANLARSVGGFHSEYDGAQDHDFILRCSEGLKKNQIIHIPKVLYHWRSTESSTAENPNAKLYAYEAGARAVEDHLKRMGIGAKVGQTEHLGFFRINYASNSQDVCKMTQSQFEALNEIQFELIRQEYIMVLADNLKPTSKDYVDGMLSCMLHEGVGAVTGKIIAKNGTIESAGFDRKKGHKSEPRFKGLNRHFSGYMHRANLQQQVTGYDRGCVLFRKKALKDIGMDIALYPEYSIYYEPGEVFKRKLL